MANQPLQEICCCMGQPAAGNPTQYMMERALAKAGLDWVYLTLEVAPADLADAVRGMRAMGFRGGNFTIPHKVAVVELLDELSESARLMGAVNCVIREGKKLLGENTDGKGFLAALRGLIDPAGKRVVILGAGGAARAISVELGLAGAAEIEIVGRTPERAEPLVAILNEKVHVAAKFTPWQGEYVVPSGTEILVNATSIGLGDSKARVPVAKESLEQGTIVADVVYNPAETRLLAEAKARGCATLDGLGMLVGQGAIAFRLWTGIEPDAAVMRDAVEEFLGL